MNPERPSIDELLEHLSKKTGVPNLLKEIPYPKKDGYTMVDEHVGLK